MANERTLGLRTDDKKVEENWKKIDWAKTTTDNEEPNDCGIEIELSANTPRYSDFSSIKGFTPLYTIPYEDGDKELIYAKTRTSHVFALKDNRLEKSHIVEADSDSFLTDALLGLMNEIHLLRTVEGLSNN